jgi:hypothetical protein
MAALRNPAQAEFLDRLMVEIGRMMSGLKEEWHDPHHGS